MKFEEALTAMKEGKKVISNIIMQPIFIADYTNSFGETYKEIVWEDSTGIRFFHHINHNDIFAEDWKIVDEDRNNG